MSQEEQLAALGDIRNMMQRSAKFLSLSGLSGISAGICALIGAAAVPYRFGINMFENISDMPILYASQNRTTDILFFLIDAACVLFFALAFGSFFTWRRARKNGWRAFDHTSIILVINIMVPLSVGGLFCLMLLYHGVVGLVAPAMLIFYGMTLYNAGKFTHEDVRYLGICEMILGLIASVYIGYGLFFWAIGFGVLHIIYGVLLWYKYERN